MDAYVTLRQGQQVYSSGVTLGFTPEVTPSCPSYPFLPFLTLLSPPIPSYLSYPSYP